MRMTGILAILIGLLLGALVEGWQVDVTAVGPRVGERVPDFVAVDQTGTTRTLQSVLGPNGAMIVFYRSADW
jgi:hypothetical protein